jgi:hypothetical protein
VARARAGLEALPKEEYSCSNKHKPACGRAVNGEVVDGDDCQTPAGAG